MRIVATTRVKMGHGITSHYPKIRGDEPFVGILLSWLVLLAIMGPFSTHSVMAAAAATETAKPQNESAPAVVAPGQQIGFLYIRAYRVDGGANLLPRIQIEEAVYPYLGPGRTENDVEQARAALEKTFRDKGFQTVAVQIPPQQVRRGVVVLQVVEAKVGKLRVKGARYFLPSDIRKGAPSLFDLPLPFFHQQ